MKNILLVAIGIAISGTFAAAQPPAAAGAAAEPQRERRAPDPRSMGGGDCRDNPYNCADAPNPLPAANTVWLEEMTWMDVRDALKAGKSNIIISTGGIEPNGPWLVTGKHNYVLHANCEAIARKMGNALCAPIVKYVPEGDIATKSGHMASPGTMTMREETFRAVLTDAAESLQCAVDQSLQVGGVRDVAAHRERSEPLRLALEQLTAPREHRHVRALGGQRLRDRQADPRRGPADDRRATAEPELHPLPG